MWRSKPMHVNCQREVMRKREKTATFVISAIKHGIPRFISISAKNRCPYLYIISNEPRTKAVRPCNWPQRVWWSRFRESWHTDTTRTYIYMHTFTYNRPNGINHAVRSPITVVWARKNWVICWICIDNNAMHTLMINVIGLCIFIIKVWVDWIGL